MKINVKNNVKLDAAIISAEGKSRERLMTSDKVHALIIDIESTLQFLALKADWIGSKFDLTIPCQVPVSYRGVPSSTFVRIERYPSGWFVIEINRNISKYSAILPIKIPDFNQSDRHLSKIFNRL